MLPPARRRATLAEAACLLGLLGFALALTAPVLAGGVPVATDTLRLWGPQAGGAPGPVHNADLADSALLYLPWQVFIRRSLAGGEWPLWNPDLFAGYPFQGNPQTQLYYPIMWLLWLLPLPLALPVGAVFHIWLAGAGMYVLARVLGAGRAGSLLAGLAFAGSGQFYLAIELPGVAYIYGWLPWVLAAAEIAWRRRSWAWTAGAGLLFGVLALAGHLQWFIYSGVFLGAWLLARLLAAGWDARRAGARPGRGWRGQAARAAAVLAWGPALGAVQILPFLELAGQAARAPAARISTGQISRALRLLVPQFFGTSVGSVGDPLPFNYCWYVGLAPLALALLALLLRRERRVWFLGLLGGAAWAAANSLPGFNQFQRLPLFQAQLPQRVAYLFIVCAALLAGLGFDALLRRAQRRPRQAAALLLALGIVALPLVWSLLDLHAASAGQAALYRLQSTALGQAGLVVAALAAWAGAAVLSRGGRRPAERTLLAGLLLALTAWDLLTYAPGYNTYVPAAALAPQDPLAARMRADSQPWRMLAPDAPAPTYVPNMALLYGLHDVQGYDSLHLARYEGFWAAADPSVRGGSYFNVMLRPQNYGSNQAALLNVTYLPVRAPAALAARAPLSPALTLLASAPSGGLYRNPAALPRAFVVHAAAVVAAATIPARLAAPGFDPAATVLIEQSSPAWLAAPSASGGPAGTAIITRYRNLSVDVTARMDRPGWLVLGDVNYPGWQVTVDGQPAPLYTGDYVLRAVPLPAGPHQVHFFFQPASVLFGGAVSLLALLAAFAVLLRLPLSHTRLSGGRRR